VPIKLEKELEKKEYVSTYMREFKRMVLIADYEKKLTAREEQLLACERESCQVFYDEFVYKHGRGPDVNTLKEQVKTNFLLRAPIYARLPIVMDEENFIEMHRAQIIHLKELCQEAYYPDCYTHILDREKQIASDYFRKHDDYPTGYEDLVISRSPTVVRQGLSFLLTNFYDNYRLYYERFRREDYV